MVKKQTSNIIIDSGHHSWKRRPSEIRGYHRAIYLTSDNGDYLRVDYNIKDKRVRLYLEISSEGGNAYYSVISNGRITAEKSVSTGRTFGFADKFKNHADLFSTIPNKEVLKLIDKNYGIQKKKNNASDEKTEREKQIEETKRRYFKRDDVALSGNRIRSDGHLFRSANLVDLVDAFFGLLISGGIFFYSQFDYLTTGIVSIIFGIVIGLVDIFFRGRSPLFSKVTLFLLGGSAIYIYGYFF